MKMEMKRKKKKKNSFSQSGKIDVNQTYRVGFDCGI